MARIIPEKEWSQVAEAALKEGQYVQADASLFYTKEGMALTERYPGMLTDRLPAYLFAREPVFEEPAPLRNTGNTCYLNAILQALYAVADMRRVYLRTRWSDGVPVEVAASAGKDDLFTEDGGRRLRQFARAFHDGVSMMFEHMAARTTLTAPASRDYAAMRAHVHGSDVAGSLYYANPESVPEVLARVFSSVADPLVPAQPAIAAAYARCALRYRGSITDKTIELPHLVVCINDGMAPRLELREVLAARPCTAVPYAEAVARFEGFGRYLFVSLEYGSVHKAVSVGSLLELDGTRLEPIAAVYRLVLQDGGGHFVTFTRTDSGRWYAINDAEAFPCHDYPLDLANANENFSLTFVIFKNQSI